MISSYLEAAFSTACIGGVLAIIYGPFQSAIVALLRQRVFEQRDRLFDLAVAGKVDFSSPEYIHMRDEINNILAFSCEATVPRILCHAFTKRNHSNPKNEIKQTTSFLESLPQDTRNIMGDIFNKVGLDATLFMLARSPMVWVLFVIAIPLIALFILLAGGGKSLKSVLEPIENKMREDARSYPYRVGRV